MLFGVTVSVYTLGPYQIKDASGYGMVASTLVAE